MKLTISYFKSLPSSFFQQERLKDRAHRQKSPSKACIQRWEDEGGTTRHIPSLRIAT